MRTTDLIRSHTWKGLLRAYAQGTLTGATSKTFEDYWPAAQDKDLKEALDAAGVSITKSNGMVTVTNPEAAARTLLRLAGQKYPGNHEMERVIPEDGDTKQWKYVYIRRGLLWLWSKGVNVRAGGRGGVFEYEVASLTPEILNEVRTRKVGLNLKKEREITSGRLDALEGQNLLKGLFSATFADADHAVAVHCLSGDPLGKLEEILGTYDPEGSVVLFNNLGAFGNQTVPEDREATTRKIESGLQKVQELEQELRETREALEIYKAYKEALNQGSPKRRLLEWLRDNGAVLLATAPEKSELRQLYIKITKVGVNRILEGR